MTQVVKQTEHDNDLDGFRAASSQLRYAHSSSRRNQNDNVFRLIRLERQDGRLGGLFLPGRVPVLFQEVLPTVVPSLSQRVPSGAR